MAVSVEAEKAGVAISGYGGDDVISMVLAGGMRAEGADSFCKSLLAH